MQRRCALARHRAEPAHGEILRQAGARLRRARVSSRPGTRSPTRASTNPLRLTPMKAANASVGDGSLRSPGVGKLPAERILPPKHRRIHTLDEKKRGVDRVSERFRTELHAVGVNHALGHVAPLKRRFSKACSLDAREGLN